MGRRGARLLGRAAHGWLRRVARGADLRVTAAARELEREQSCAPLAARLVDDASRGHAIVAFWSAQQLTMALLATPARFGFHPVLERYDVVADDSTGGEMMATIGAGAGWRMRPIHARGNPQRLEDVGAWIRQPAPFLIAIDGGATYGTVPTGIVRLAARLRSRVWPVAACARPVVRVPGLIAEIPLPRVSVALAVAAPLRIGRDTRVAAAAADLKWRLDEATAAARGLLVGRRARAEAKDEIVQWRRAD